MGVVVKRLSDRQLRAIFAQRVQRQKDLKSGVTPEEEIIRLRSATFPATIDSKDIFLTSKQVARAEAQRSFNTLQPTQSQVRAQEQQTFADMARSNIAHRKKFGNPQPKTQKQLIREFRNRDRAGMLVAAEAFPSVPSEAERESREAVR